MNALIDVLARASRAGRVPAALAALVAAVALSGCLPSGFDEDTAEGEVGTVTVGAPSDADDPSDPDDGSAGTVTTTTTTTTTEGLPQVSEPDLSAGMTVITYGNDPLFETKLDRLFPRLSQLGITHVSMAFPIFTDGVSSDRVFTDPELTPDSGRILAFGRAAREYGMTAGLNPILDEAALEAEGGWRGGIEPADRDNWFVSYGELLDGFAELAGRGGFQIFNIGTELESLMDDPRWSGMVERVRAIYAGKLSYAMVGTRVTDLRIPQVAKRVDLIGVNAWYGAKLPVGAVPAEIFKALRKWPKKIERFGERAGRPVYFSEAGSPSTSIGYVEPTVVDATASPSGDAQGSSYGALCRLAQRSGAVGLVWWATTLDPPEQAELDRGYDPLGKPAEQLLAGCLASVDTEVSP